MTSGAALVLALSAITYLAVPPVAWANAECENAGLVAGTECGEAWGPGMGCVFCGHNECMAFAGDDEPCYESCMDVVFLGCGYS